MRTKRLGDPPTIDPRSRTSHWQKLEEVCKSVELWKCGRSIDRLVLGVSSAIHHVNGQITLQGWLCGKGLKDIHRKVDVSSWPWGCGCCMILLFAWGQWDTYDNLCSIIERVCSTTHCPGLACVAPSLATGGQESPGISNRSLRPWWEVTGQWGAIRWRTPDRV